MKNQESNLVYNQSQNASNTTKEESFLTSLDIQRIESNFHVLDTTEKDLDQAFSQALHYERIFPKYYLHNNPENFIVYIIITLETKITIEMYLRTDCGFLPGFCDKGLSIVRSEALVPFLGKCGSIKSLLLNAAYLI